MKIKKVKVTKDRYIVKARKDGYLKRWKPIQYIYVKNVDVDSILHLNDYRIVYGKKEYTQHKAELTTQLCEIQLELIGEIFNIKRIGQSFTVKGISLSKEHYRRKPQTP